MATTRTLPVLVALLGAVIAEQFSYEGYKVYRVEPSNENHLQALATLNKLEDVDFWSTFRVYGKPVDIMVSPLVQDKVVEFLEENGVNFEILIDNLESVVREERAKQLMAPRVPKGRISFKKYNRHSEINAYIDQLKKNHPRIVSVEVIGKSYKKRDLKVIKISTNPKAKKPIIFIDAGIHAREWAAPAQATYIINQLVENSANARMLKKVDWHILPVVNPDGYEFSHDKERFWRKTRSRGRVCYGTDANRNFDFHWGEVGASSDPCSNYYMGPKAFSEVETQAVRDYIRRNRRYIKLYLTFHSYGEYILFPWGYTCDLPDDYKELQDLGVSVAVAISNVSGTVYSVGTSANILYPAAGGSDDWAKGVADVELSYTIELRRGGKGGFDPPPSDILPIVRETWAGIKIYHRYIQEKFVHNNGTRHYYDVNNF